MLAWAELCLCQALKDLVFTRPLSFYPYLRRVTVSVWPLILGAVDSGDVLRLVWGPGDVEIYFGWVWSKDDAPGGLERKWVRQRYARFYQQEEKEKL